MTEGYTFTTNPTIIILFSFTIGMAPFAIVLFTSFTRITIVLFILRQAIGIQQTPPNIILYTIALSFVIFTSAPIFSEISSIIQKNNTNFSDFKSYKKTIKDISIPIKIQLKKFTNKQEISFFQHAAKKMWPKKWQINLDNNILILAPAFLLSEIERAFYIGALLYLPFVAIDLIVSNILLAMGSMMVSPLMISLPLKLLLIVSVSGWGKLLHGLLLGYQ